MDTLPVLFHTSITVQGSSKISLSVLLEQNDSSNTNFGWTMDSYV